MVRGQAEANVCIDVCVCRVFLCVCVCERKCVAEEIRENEREGEGVWKGKCESGSMCAYMGGRGGAKKKVCFVVKGAGKVRSGGRK